MRAFVAFVVIGVLTALGASAQIRADQGTPGKQGPWPVLNYTPGLDGGTVTSQSPYRCNAASPHKTVYVARPTMVPQRAADGGCDAAGLRAYVDVCVSPENSGTPKVKCRADGVWPGLGVGDAGDVLNVGDCVRYTVPGCMRCNGDGGWVTTYECI